MAVLVDAAGLSVSRSDRVLFSGLSVTVSDGDRLGVVGINGTGKSTVLRVLAGTVNAESGEVRRGRGIRIGFLDQEAPLPPGPVRAALGEGWEAEAVLERLDMGAFLDRETSELSGGQAKRVALAAVLSRPAELLVLDEPTNHLDLRAISWLEGWLAAFRGGLVLVSHDRHLLDRVTTRMLELDRGNCYVHDAGYAGYLEARSEREERAAEAEAVRRNLARAELAWLRRGAPARTRKPQARIESARRLIDSRPEAAAREGALDLGFQTPRLGSKVIEVDGVAFSYDGAAGRPVVSGVQLSLDPRERLAIVGANGSGKSTLLELLAGRIPPDLGRLEHGPTVSVGYFTQKAADLDLTARVRDLVAGPHRNPGDPAVNRLMERFWFTGELPWARVATLSGGERRRLQLLMVLASQPNVLLLDEPTNDLDLDTLRVLEDFLDSWPGALVVVSHDRVFLDRVTDRIVACRDGRVEPVAGGLAAWIAGSRAPAARPAARPAPVAKAARAPTTAGAPDASARRRSASTVGFELRRLERELSRLTRDRDRLAEALAAATDHQQMADAGSQLAVVQADLEEMEERWLAVAEEAESSR
jgi:ATP-binding cassette subfamily F protein uup